MNRLPIEDLNHILLQINEDLLKLKGSNIYITGGTGFIGKWIVESLIYANEKQNLGLNLTILTRDPVSFISKYAHIASNKSVNRRRSFAQFPTTGRHAR